MSFQFPDRYRGKDALYGSEVPWSDLYFYLRDLGYQLRERYHPDWFPSWVKDGTLSRWDAIDGYTPLRGLMDAACIRTGRLVMLKEMPIDSQEIEILKYVSTPQLRDDPRNHSLQTLDVIEHPTKPGSVIAVTPRLHRIFRGPATRKFKTVGEVLEFIHQSLEGLAFMHQHNIGHRDIHITNMMMDPKDWFSPGYNNASWSVDYCTTKPRSEVDIKYYFIDFGLSALYPSLEAREKELEGWGRYKQAPELSRTVPYDVFPLDVWCLGQVFQDVSLKIYHFLDFLHPLVDKMVLHDPTARLTASEALEEFLKLKPREDDFSDGIPLRFLGSRQWTLRPQSIRSIVLYRKWRRRRQMEGPRTQQDF